MNAVAPIEPAETPKSTLQTLTDVLRDAEFEPFQFIVDEIRRPSSEFALNVDGKVRAAETLAKLRLEYEKLEEAKKGPGRGMRMTVGADGSVQADMWETGSDDISDEQLEADIRRDIAALGFIEAPAPKG